MYSRILTSDSITQNKSLLSLLYHRNIIALFHIILCTRNIDQDAYNMLNKLSAARKSLMFVQMNKQKHLNLDHLTLGMSTQKSKDRKIGGRKNE